MEKGDGGSMSRLEGLRFQREMKELLLDNHGFEILVCRSQTDNGRDRNSGNIVFCAIVYTESGRRKWEQVVSSNRAYFSIVPTLQDLERLMNDMAASMKPQKPKSAAKRALLLE
ncbi:hypothetical protein N0V86_004033 [Didymella sp. IMI 355093]|nr:hypothetical protein N0V86_004033 [Didymella sp. IMI 355093]